MEAFRTESFLDMTLQDRLQAYTKHLEASSTNVEVLSALKTLKFQKFLELCKFHLSLAVELPPEFNEYYPSRYLVARHRKFKSFTTGLNFGREESSDVYDAVISLMDYMTSKDILRTPLIFRRTGNVGRQRNLIKRLLNGDIPSYPFYSTSPSDSSPRFIPTPGSIKQSWSRMTRSRRFKNASFISEISTDNVEELNAHDYANVLKTVLREMPDPILTIDLLPIYLSISKITSGNCDESGTRIPLSPENSRLARAKQLSAIRTLTWLLPMKNQNLLRRLLDLLTETLTYSQINRMSAECLGTIFGPLLFVPSCRPHDDLRKDYGSLNSLATVMIEQGSYGVFSVPRALLNDVKKNLTAEYVFGSTRTSRDSGLERCSVESFKQEEDLDDMVMYTSVGFAERCGDVDAESWKQSTKDALNELSAVLRKLPDSHPKKAIYLRSIIQFYGVEESENAPNLITTEACSRRRLAKLTIGRSPSTITSTSLDGSQVTCFDLRSMLPLPKKKRLLSVKGEKIESPVKETAISYPESKKKAAAVQTEGSSYFLQLPVRRNYDHRELEKLQPTFYRNFERHRHSL